MTLSDSMYYLCDRRNCDKQTTCGLLLCYSQLHWYYMLPAGQWFVRITPFHLSKTWPQHSLLLILARPRQLFLLVRRQQFRHELVLLLHVFDECVLPCDMSARRTAHSSQIISCTNSSSWSSMGGDMDTFVRCGFCRLPCLRAIQVCSFPEKHRSVTENDWKLLGQLHFHEEECPHHTTISHHTASGGHSTGHRINTSGTRYWLHYRFNKHYGIFLNRIIMKYTWILFTFVFLLLAFFTPPHHNG